MGYSLVVKTDYHSVAQDEIPEVSHRLGYLWLLKRHALEVILSTSVGKVLLFLSVLLLGILKDWEVWAKCRWEVPGVRNPAQRGTFSLSFTICCHSKPSSPQAKGKGVPLSPWPKANRSDPGNTEREGAPSITSAGMSQGTLLCVVLPELLSFVSL